MDVLDSGPIDGIVGYFDVQFCGSPEHPADVEVTRSARPRLLSGLSGGLQHRLRLC